MAGPGGGSRGGGGGFSGGGGFRGGGFGGGGFHGGGGGSFGGGHHHRPHHHHHFHMPFWGFGPWGYRYGYGRGGCLGFIFAPLIMLFIAAMLLFGVVGGAFVGVTEDGYLVYDEERLQDYANDQYYTVFSESDDIEENILIVFLAHENYTDFVYIGWVGDDVNRNINNMFGSNDTELGRAMLGNITTAGYKYSLTSNLSGVIEELTQIASVRYQAPAGAENQSYPLSRIYNYSNLQINENKVNASLEEFSRETGYSIAIAVEDMNEVFQMSYAEKVISIIIVVIFVGGAIFLIIKGIKSASAKRENIVNDPDDNANKKGGDNSGFGYYDDDGNFK